MDFFVTVIFLLAVLVLTWLFLNSGKRYGNLPPGPTPFPLIGNMMQLAGKDLRQVCKECRKTYGDIFTLHMFNRALIIVNGFETIKDVWAKNLFAGKAKMEVWSEGLKGEGIIFSNGEIWKHNRRSTIRTLRDFGMGKSKLENGIHNEISYFLEVLEKEQDKPFDIENLTKIATSNVMCTIVFGKRFDYRDEEFIDIIRRASEVMESDMLINPYWLRYIPGDPFHVRQVARSLKEINDYIRTEIQEHYKDFDAGNLRDIIDGYIKQMKSGESCSEPSLMNEDEITLLVRELFIAGTETSSTALRIAAVCMLRHPEMQENLSREVRTVVPDHRLPDSNDIQQMPFLQAVISEILRWGCVVPFSGRLVTGADRQYRDYTFPKSASIMINFQSVLSDESTWEEPLDFNPSRFIIDDKLQPKPKELIPFALGPRSCPGESMGLMELKLFLSAMVQRFQFLPPEGEGPPSTATKLGISAAPLPFRLRAIKRV